MLKIDNLVEDHRARQFIENFFHPNKQPKFIFGRNKYAESIANMVDVDGFIDDFTEEKVYIGKPIIPINQVPQNALVVLTQIGNPFGAEKRVRQFQFSFLDYFSFFRYAPQKPKMVEFWEGFQEDFVNNRDKYEHLYNSLGDDISQNQFYNLINFRLSYDLYYMRGFLPLEDKQYFESFIPYSKEEVFVDIGSFDGYTTQEFIRICPHYKAVHVFEPEEKNMKSVKQKLMNYERLLFHQKGLFHQKQTLRLDFAGSASKISQTGETVIEVDKLDNLIKDTKPTFIKMDIEGAEKEAIEGSKSIIQRYHPKLAISVYHQGKDFREIPALIFSINPNYKLYLRHYTQGISETIMFFLPQD